MNGRLSVYLGKSSAHSCVRLDIMVVKELGFSLHQESSYDHISQLVLWLGKHDENCQQEIEDIIEFSVEEIRKYLHVLGLH